MENKLRDKNVILTEGDLMFVIAGQLYAQAPNHTPRKADVILTKVNNKFREDCLTDYGDWHYKYIEEKKIYDYIYKLLFSIPEFEELNLSLKEYEKGINVNDESGPKFNLYTAYDIKTEESWKDDFIDLDAFVNNVVHELYKRREKDSSDCYFCIHKDTNLCEECKLNRNITVKYEGNRIPKGSYRTACKFDCPVGNYICCDECSKKDTCEQRCPGKLETCKNLLYYINNIKSEDDNK